MKQAVFLLVIISSISTIGHEVYDPYECIAKVLYDPETINLLNSMHESTCIAQVRHSYLFSMQNPDNLSNNKNNNKKYHYGRNLKLQNSHGSKSSYYDKDKNSKFKADLSQTIGITKAILQFERLPPCWQAEILKCNPNLEQATERCESVYGEGNCEQFNLYIVEKCSENLENDGMMCIGKCPYNMEDDGILCKKPLIQRRDFISNQNPKQLNLTLQHDYKPYGAGHLVKKCEAVKPGMLLDDMGPNLCNPRCPVGWIDIGRYCRKVNVQIRDALFVYGKGDL